MRLGMKLFAAWLIALSMGGAYAGVAAAGETVALLMQAESSGS